MGAVRRVVRDGEHIAAKEAARDHFLARLAGVPQDAVTVQVGPLHHDEGMRRATRRIEPCQCGLFGDDGKQQQQQQQPQR